VMCVYKFAVEFYAVVVVVIVLITLLLFADVFCICNVWTYVLNETLTCVMYVTLFIAE